MHKQSAILNIYKHSVCKCDRRWICSQLLGSTHTFSLLALHRGSMFSALALPSLSINNRFPPPQPPTLETNISSLWPFIHYLYDQRLSTPKVALNRPETDHTPDCHTVAHSFSFVWLLWSMTKRFHPVWPYAMWWRAKGWQLKSMPVPRPCPDISSHTVPNITAESQAGHPSNNTQKWLSAIF